MRKSSIIGLAAMSMLAAPVAASEPVQEARQPRLKGPRSRYMPHQGEREIARRQKQARRAALKAMVRLDEELGFYDDERVGDPA